MSDWEKVTEALDDLTGRAKKCGLGLALGTCYVEDDGRCYNQIRFYDPDGGYLGFHSKTLTCGTLTDPPEGEINHYSTRPLRTFDFRGITIGGLVCNDLWANPCCTPMPDIHLTQRLSEMGAKVVFHAVNGGRSDSPSPDDTVRGFHESNLRMRAQAGRLWIVSVDNCYPFHGPCSSVGGHRSSRKQGVEMPDKGEQLSTRYNDDMGVLQAMENASTYVRTPGSVRSTVFGVTPNKARFRRAFGSFTMPDSSLKVRA